MKMKTNIEEKLRKSREKRISEASILREVSSILLQNDKDRNRIKESLASKNTNQNNFKIAELEAEHIFHISDIKKICVDYRLRFLDSHFFKGNFPEEAISKIRALERTHETALSGFKVVAPSKRMKLENADDPLLFAPLGNDYYYFIHKWGNDLHPLRKWLMWPYKSFENMVFAIFILSILLTAMTPMKAFTPDYAMQEYFMLFLFMFKAVGGIVIFYGFAKGKNFNKVIWDSKFYNA